MANVPFLLNDMAEHRITELGFKPRTLGRHDASRIRNRHKISDIGREHREGAGIFTGIDELFQLTGSAYAADEIDSFAGARVINTEQRFEHVSLQQGDVQLFDWIRRG